MHAIVATLALAASLHAPQRTYVRTTRPNSLRSGAAAALERLRGGDAEAATADGGGSASIEEGPEEWDYIIVGGGAAGCVLAERLTAADPECRVLMLEAGVDGSRDMRIRVPAALVKVFKSEHDWDFHTEPVDGTRRGVYLCRGKVLGGSSSTNVMLYHRGTPADYDSWVARGAEGWGPGQVLDYYRKAEDHSGGPSQYHGTGGPMPVQDVPYVNPLSESFLEAAGELGYRRNLDFNDWSAPQDGFGRFKVTQRNGERCSTWNAYGGARLRERKNMCVRTGCLVTKVALEGSGDELCACGIEYSSAEGHPRRAQLAAGGEVLMSAGAVQSPQILMLSGLGPREHLAEVGVDVRKDLRGVGVGLQDHPSVLVSYGSSKPVSITDEIRLFGTSLPNPLTLFKWLTMGKGALTTVACEFGGFFRTNSKCDQPDLQVRFVAAKALSADGISTLEKFGAGLKTTPGYTTQLVGCRPRSAGTVRLRSASPHEKPIIDGLHLSSEEDVVTLREAVKLGRKICTTRAFDKYRTEEVYPGAAVQTDAEIDEYVRATVHSANALTGSCRMGAANNPLAVLDPELRVRGVGSLRVVDASAFPHIIGGQTCAPTIMLAEKAADMVMRQRVALKSYSRSYQQDAAAFMNAQAQAQAQQPVAAAA